MSHAHIEPRSARRAGAATSDRLVTGLDSLLSEREFDAIGIREILRASECSPSAMYGPGRSTNKEELLNLLHERWIDQIREALPVGAGIPRTVSPDLDSLVFQLVHYLVDCVQSAPLRFRAFRRSQHPEIRARTAQLYADVFAVLLPMTQGMLPHLDALEVEFRLRFGSRVVIGAACDLCDYGDDMGIGLPFDSRQAAAVLTEMIQRFLGGGSTADLPELSRGNRSQTNR